MDLGFERAGWKVSWQVELDGYRRFVLSKHWPWVKRWDDIRTFLVGDSWNIDDYAVDMICGGFPCKQTSIQSKIRGHNCGLAGADSGLYWQMLRVVRLVKPTWVVVENVANALVHSTEIEGGLAEVGYRVLCKPVVLQAEALGAPHKRERVFWIAHAESARLEASRIPNPFQIENESRRGSTRDHWLCPGTGVL